jgi:hypothetical protein
MGPSFRRVTEPNAVPQKRVAALPCITARAEPLSADSAVRAQTRRAKFPHLRPFVQRNPMERGLHSVERRPLRKHVLLPLGKWASTERRTKFSRTMKSSKHSIASRPKRKNFGGGTPSTCEHHEGAIVLSEGAAKKKTASRASSSCHMVPSLFQTAHTILHDTK